MPYLGVTPSTAAGADLDGKELILDADADTTITADTDDQIDIKIAGADDFSFKANTFEVQTGSNIDMNGTELILDANGNTSITADSDDQIDIKIAGADDFQFTANTMSVLSGSTLNIDSGATIANSGTATGFTQFANWSQSSGHLTPDNNTYGIHLGVDTATAANLLDDYEEGSWTPLMKGGATDMTTSGYGRYQKIGRVVWLYFNVNVTNQNSASGNLTLYTLPFTTATYMGHCRLGGGDRVDADTLHAVTGGSQTYLNFNHVSTSSSSNAGAATVSNTLGTISPYNNTGMSGIFCYEI